jgi:hypothetical protein
MHEEPLAGNECPEGETIVRLIDSTIRLCAPTLGVGRRWLKELLGELGVKIRVSEGCLQDLVNDADAATRCRLSASAERQSYLSCLREELASRAEFVRRWTFSDERIDSSDLRFETLVRIARNYALPRPWKLSDPVATTSERRQPYYWRWASRSPAAAALPRA